MLTTEQPHPRSHRTKLRVFILLAAIAAIVASCSDAKDNSDQLLNTQFSVEIEDSLHLLSPKTYSYLHNLVPPLGIKPVIATAGEIADNEMSNYADSVFDAYCRKPYSGNSFYMRGILIVASKNPELIQVRVGKTYDVYCRMRGSAAGAGYLSMQKETAERGIDEMSPIALKNVIKDIEDCRQLPWYKKVALKMSFVHVETFMDDLATPSQGFFNRFYFRPFLYLVGGVKSILGNWVLAFLLIIVAYMVIKHYLGIAYWRKLDTIVKRHSDDDEDYQFNSMLAQQCSALFFAIVKVIVTLPTLAAISVLSTSRLEDIIALKYYHIPSVDALTTITHWTNGNPELWLVLLMVMVYYLKFMLCDTGSYTLGNTSESLQQHFYSRLNNAARNYIDRLATFGYNRGAIISFCQLLFALVTGSMFHHNIQELSTTGVVSNTAPETDNEGKPQKRLVDFLFYGTESALYKRAPYYTILVNKHREAIFFTFVMCLAATALFSYTYTVYFLILWLVQLIYRVVCERNYAHKVFKGNMQEVRPFHIFNRTWWKDLLCLGAMVVVFFVFAPSYAQKDTGAVDISQALPDDLSGMYFISKEDGADVKGATARIVRDGDGNYYMQVYDNRPVRRLSLNYDKEQGLFHSDILGDGYITYDARTKTTTINFSDLWILTN